MNILVVDDDETLRDLVSLILRSNFLVNILEAASKREAVEYIDLHPELDCIICDYNLGDGTGGEIFKHLKEKAKGKKHIPFVLCSTDRAEEHDEFAGHELADSIVKPNISKPLIRFMNGLIHTAHAHAEAPLSYSKVKLATLLKANQLPCPVFIKLNEKKHVKVLNEGDVFDIDTMAHYATKKVSDLHVHTRDAAGLIQTVIRNIVSLEHLAATDLSPSTLERLSTHISDEQIKQDLVSLAREIQNHSNSVKTLAQAFNLSEQAHETMHNAVNRLGVTPEVQTLIKTTAQLAIMTIHKHPMLSELFQRITISEHNYINEHSVMLSLVTNALASAMGWSSNITRYKLILASFLHDITLSNHELARIQTLADLSLQPGRFSAQEIENYERHPEAAALLLNDLNDMPSDVDAIIRQHHELPDGSGFPAHLTHHKITPLSALFIVAHDMVSFYFENPNLNWDLKIYLNLMAPKYGEGHFKHVIEAVHRMDLRSRNF